MNRHAFLIIAHNEFDILQRLVSALDDSRVDFFIHFDAKVKNLPELSARFSGIFPVTDRVDTRWGDYSQIETELRLFSFVQGHKGYCFYHLISGVHYPLVPVGRLLDYYDKYVGCNVFCGLCKDVEHQELMKLRHMNLFTRRLGFGPSFQRRFFQILWRLSDSVQSFLHIERNASVDFYKAANWVSLSSEGVSCLLESQDMIRRVFRRSFCGDEYFAPTVLMDSPLRDSVLNDNSMLLQIMGEASPTVFTKEDYPFIKSSGCLFARKFSYSASLPLMDMIDAGK